MITNRGLRHVALRVANVERAKDFYIRTFGMKLVWQPDPDNAYLSTGCDNLALHRTEVSNAVAQNLDHLGFIVQDLHELKAAFEWAKTAGLHIERPLRNHRDGSSSFYLRDPDGNMIQVLYEPTISPMVLRPEERPEASKPGELGNVEKSRKG
jgi:catechol 2,3-dioxygenase-like lactoylglutathione lyase family enzyme